jgi:hypothetical protein
MHTRILFAAYPKQAVHNPPKPFPPPPRWLGDVTMGTTVVKELRKGMTVALDSDRDDDDDGGTTIGEDLTLVMDWRVKVVLIFSAPRDLFPFSAARPRGMLLQGVFWLMFVGHFGADALDVMYNRQLTLWSISLTVCAVFILRNHFYGTHVCVYWCEIMRRAAEADHMHSRHAKTIQTFVRYSTPKSSSSSQHADS